MLCIAIYCIIIMWSGAGHWGPLRCVFACVCRLYSCLANGSAEEFQKGDHLFKAKAVKEALQIGMHCKLSLLLQKTKMEPGSSIDLQVCNFCTKPWPNPEWLLTPKLKYMITTEVCNSKSVFLVQNLFYPGMPNLSFPQTHYSSLHTLICEHFVKVKDLNH